MPIKLVKLTKQEILKIVREEGRVSTAYHESSHGVVSTLLDLPFERIEVFSDKYPAPPELKGRYAGIVHNNWPLNSPCYAMPWHRLFWTDGLKYWEGLICVALAGELAESQFLGYGAEKLVSRYDRNDIRLICRCVLEWPASLMKIRVALLKVRTQGMLHQVEVWNAVTAVAEALLERNVLTQAEVRVLVESHCTTFPASHRTPKLSKPAKHEAIAHPVKPRLVSIPPNRIQDYAAKAQG